MHAIRITIAATNTSTEELARTTTEYTVRVSTALKIQITTKTPKQELND